MIETHTRETLEGLLRFRPLRQEVARNSVLGSLCFAALACTTGSPPDAPAPQRPTSVILVSVDDLRADALGSYNPEVKWTPHLDELARSSWVFRDTVSQVSSTLQSHRSIFFSVYPHLHGASLAERGNAPVESPMMRLRARGLRTAGFVGGGQMRRRFGWAEEFEVYHDRISKFDELRRQSLRWLRKVQDQPFFLFLHTYAVHCPFSPPEPYRSKHAGWYTGSLSTDGKCGVHFNRMDLGPDDIRYVRDLYAAEVEWTDAFLGDLFDRLKRMDLFENTLIVVMSDHGESLGEGGFIGHNKVTPVHLAVPLIVKVPDREPVLVDAPVQNLDIFPTIFDVLGAEPPYPLQGRSLVEATAGSTDWESRARFAEAPGRDYAAVIRDRWHLVFPRSGRSPARLYDRIADPEALADRALDRPEIVDSLIQEYNGIIAEDALYKGLLLPRRGAENLLDEETLRDLRALGYVQ